MSLGMRLTPVKQQPAHLRLEARSEMVGILVHGNHHFILSGPLPDEETTVPPVLSIEVDGIGSRSWFGRERKSRWEDVASLHFNTGSRQFTVRAGDGRQISHAGFNADPGLFQDAVHSRTRLPMEITRPGTWKSETFEVPYEDFEAEEEVSGDPS